MIIIGDGLKKVVKVIGVLIIFAIVWRFIFVRLDAQVRTNIEAGLRNSFKVFDQILLGEWGQILQKEGGKIISGESSEEAVKKIYDEAMKDDYAGGWVPQKVGSYFWGIWDKIKEQLKF